MPRHIDDQPQYLFWEMDEVTLVVVFAAIGVLSESLMMMSVLGLFAAKWLSRNKQRHLPGLTLHLAYWAGMTQLSYVHRNGAMREIVA